MSKFWENLVRPALFALDAERAHEIGMSALKSGLAVPFYVDDPAFGFEPIEIFGLTFANPLGIAAGFDKNGIVIDQLASLGFGFVEVGTVTCHPQPGNPRPRLFRLPADQALINRLGFNNEGATAAAERIRGLNRKCVVGVNIGKNKDVPNEEATENYLAAFRAVFDVADYIAINISSPNTPNLRELQNADHLDDLLRSLQGENRKLSARAGSGNKPLLVKIAPDLSEAEIEAVVDTVLRHKVSGIIATNTTVSRTGVRSTGVEHIGSGGLSGRPLAARSDQVIATIYRYGKGKVPVIGVGGVFTAQDAFEKIAAGASLVQAYTGFIYGGPRFAKDVLTGLRQILAEHGFKSVCEAVGSATLSEPY